MTLTDHYYGVYALLRSMSNGEVKIPEAVVAEVAWASQAVDEYREERMPPRITLLDDDGSTLDFYIPVPTQSYRYWSAIRQKSRDVWQPFHFPPNDKGGAVVEAFPDWLVGVFLQAVSNLLFTLRSGAAGEDGTMDRDVQYRAHILGILWHAMWDSVSHQGFAPIRDPHNSVHWPWYTFAWVAPNVGHADAGSLPDTPGAVWTRDYREGGKVINNTKRWQFAYTLTVDLLGQHLDIEGGKKFLGLMKFNEFHQEALTRYIEEGEDWTEMNVDSIPKFALEPMKKKYTIAEWYGTRHSTFLTAATAQRINALAVVSRGI